MIATQISRSLWSANLHEIFIKLYPLQTVQHHHESYFRPAAHQVGVSPKEGKLKKADCCDDLVQLEINPELRTAFFQQMPENVRLALSIVSSAQFVTVSELESMLGCQILEIPERSPKTYHRPMFRDIQENPDFDLLIFQQSGHGYDSHLERSQIFASLPPALAALCQIGLPKPKEAVLKSHATYQPTVTASRLFPTEHTITSPADFLQTLEFLLRNSMDLTVDGLLKVPTTKKLSKFYGDREFFASASDSADLHVLRARLMGNFLQIARQSGWDVKMEMLSDADGFRREQRKLVKHLHGEFFKLWPLLLPYLRLPGRRSSAPDLMKLWKNVLSIFTDPTPNDWIISDELGRYLSLNPEQFSYARPSELESVNVEFKQRSRYYYRSCLLNPEDVMELFFLPLIKSTAFLLAALGYLQLCYTKPPVGKNYSLKKYAWLTPYDGLLAWRLTPLGAYVFGRSEELTLHADEFQSMTVRFYSEQPLVRVENGTPVTNKFLEQYLERLTDGFYRFDRLQFFKGCKDMADVKTRMKEFMDRVPGKMPPNWIQMFREIDHSATAIHEEPSWRVFRLEPTSPLVGMVSTDRVLSKHFHKISGGRVGLLEKDWPKVQKRLQELGYYL